MLVRADLGGLGFTSGNDGSNATAMVPIPADAMADLMADGSMAIIDRVNLIEWDFYPGAGGRAAAGAAPCARTSA